MADNDATFSKIPPPPTPEAERVDVVFEGEFVEMIDELVQRLVSTQSFELSKLQRRRIAVATAVSTLGAYAGKSLYVRENSQYLEIKGLWRP